MSFMTLKRKYPEIAEEWDVDKNGKTAGAVSCDSTEVVWWKCRHCGRGWLDLIRNRTQKGKNCPYCKRENTKRTVKTRVGEVPVKKLLQKQNPAIAREWDAEKNGKTADELLWDSVDVGFWKCSECGGTWLDLVRNRTQKGKNCAYCRSKQERERRNKDGKRG